MSKDASKDNGSAASYSTTAGAEPVRLQWARGHGVPPTLGHVLLLPLFVFTFVAIATGMSVWAFHEWLVSWQLKRVGMEAQAEVIDRRVSSDSDGDSYYLTYRFDASWQGIVQSFQQEQQVPSAWYDQGEPGVTIPIKYLPATPSVSRIDGSSLLGLGGKIAVGLFLVLWDSLTVIAAFAITQNAARAWYGWQELRKRGHNAPATILNRWTESGDDSTSYYVTYRFDTPLPGWGTQCLIIEKESVSITQFRRLYPGATVTVRYAERDPSIGQIQR